MKHKLEDAAKYVKGEKPDTFFSRLLSRAVRIFTFGQERTNRFRRFIAIIAAYKRGMSIEDIIKKYEISRTNLFRYLRMAGVERKRRGFDPELRAAVLQDYRDGKSLAEIEAIHGVSQQYISIQARKEGISRRRPWKRKRKNEML